MLRFLKKILWSTTANPTWEACWHPPSQAHWQSVGMSFTLHSTGFQLRTVFWRSQGLKMGYTSEPSHLGQTLTFWWANSCMIDYLIKTSVLVKTSQSDISGIHCNLGWFLTFMKILQFWFFDFVNTIWLWCYEKI